LTGSGRGVKNYFGNKFPQIRDPYCVLISLCIIPHTVKANNDCLFNGNWILWHSRFNVQNMFQTSSYPVHKPLTRPALSVCLSPSLLTDRPNIRVPASYSALHIELWPASSVSPLRKWDAVTRLQGMIVGYDRASIMKHWTDYLYCVQIRYITEAKYTVYT
jgi:hypothetical protein